MNYQEFKQTVTTSIQHQLGPNVKVTVQEILKNNDTHLDGLTILSKQINISPTIYLNYYFQQYESGKSISDICKDILTTYKENQPEQNIDISFFTEYDNVKDRIVFKLVNYERNKKLLEKVPHYRYLDLAIIFNYLLDSDHNGSATILIYHHHLAFWHITKDDLYALAMQNTPRLLSYELRNMTDVIKELMIDIDEVTDEHTALNDTVPMYVLSNNLKLNGSSCILYQNLLEDFAKKIDCDLFILPSSIHEVLILPAVASNSVSELTQMVREVNDTQLSKEEILSDHVYFYSRESKELTM